MFCPAGNPRHRKVDPRPAKGGLLVSASRMAFGLSGGSGLTGRIEDTFVQRLNALPQEGRLLLRLAAADPTGDPQLVWRPRGGSGLQG